MRRYIAAILCVVFLCPALASAQVATQAISLTIELNVDNGELEVDLQPGASLINMAGDSYSDIIQEFTVAATSIVDVAAGVATYGVAMFRSMWTNEDHYIEFGPIESTNFYPVIKLKSAEVYGFRMHTTNAWYGHAVGASLNARITVVED